MCEIGVGFSFAALSVFRLRRAEAVSALWIPHWHSEPFQSQGTRAAKRYVNGNLVEREQGDEFGIETRPGRFSGFRNLLGACRGEEATRNTAGRRRWGIPVSRNAREGVAWAETGQV